MVDVPTTVNGQYTSSGQASNTLFDARGSSLSLPFPALGSNVTVQNVDISSSGTNLYWYGGFLYYEEPLDIAYTDSYHYYGTINQRCLLCGNQGNGIQVVAARTDNSWDSMRPTRSENFLMSGIYSTHIRDDWIENDNFAAGVIEDCLIDGTYVFYSARSGGFDGDPPSRSGHHPE